MELQRRVNEKRQSTTPGTPRLICHNLGRLLTKGYPDAGVERFAYTLNAVGPTSYTNQLGTNVVNYAYDPLGRKITEVYPGIATNSFAYDGVGNLLTLTDGKNQVTTWHYDQYGRATNKVDATITEILRYAYDPDNRLTNRWSAAKGNTAYTFDRAGNLLTINYPHSRTVSYSYDLLNRLTNMVDGVGTTLYGYTSAGLLASEDGPWTDDTVSYTYNFQRLRNALSVLAPNASPWTQSYGYDGAERLTNLTSPAGIFGYGYDATRHAQVGSLTLPSTAFITNTFDSVARLLSTALKNSGATTLNSHQYTYDLAGERTVQTRTEGNYVNYSYDGVGELTSAIGSEPGGSTVRLNEYALYYYDPAGNLSSRHLYSLAENFGINTLNELSSFNRVGFGLVMGTTTSPATNVTVNGAAATLYSDNTFVKTTVNFANGNNALTAVAKDSYGRVDTNAVNVYLPTTNSFVYDPNGNLTNDGLRSFVYDDENQLISVVVTNNSGTSTRSDFVYDGKMRRRWRFESAWSSTAWVTNITVRYVYDGNLVIQERDANNLPLVSYTRGRDLSGGLQGAGGIGGLLARTDHSLSTLNSPFSTAFYHADGNGNITCLINTNQAIVAKYLFDPFGSILSKSGPLADANLYRFSSKEFHPNSGAIYYLYRFYDPNLQRWLNRDPIAELGGLNLYAYVGNHAPNLVDSLGLLDYYYSRGGFLHPSGPVPYLEADSTLGNVGAGAYNTIPFVYDALFGPLFNIGTGPGNVRGNGGSGLQMGVAVTYDALAVLGVVAPVAMECRLASAAAAADTAAADTAAADVAAADAAAAEDITTFPKPPVPSGPKPAEMSKLLGFGSGADVPGLQQTFTKEFLQQNGITKDIANQWREVYRWQVENMPNNPAAPGRLELMNRILKVLE